MVDVRRDTAIIGATLLAVGFPLFAYAYTHPFTGTIVDRSMTVERGTYTDIYSNLSKGSVRVILNSTLPVDLIVLDDTNAHRFKTNQTYGTLLSAENTMSINSGISVTREDTYHFITNNAKNTANAYVKFTLLGTHTAYIYGFPISLLDVAATILIGGLVATVLTLFLKDKKSEAAPVTHRPVRQTRQALLYTSPRISSHNQRCRPDAVS